MTGSDAFDPIEFLVESVAIPSHEDVADMRAFLVDVLIGAGISPTVESAGTVIATRGTGRPHLMLNTHLDTVPPHIPPTRRGTRLLGRGSCDAKGPLAAMLSAFLAPEEPAGRVTLAVTPDEERTSTGAAALTESLFGGAAESPDAVVVGEPTGGVCCHAARGRFEGTVTIAGERAHAAEPASGVNAIAAAAAVLSALETFDTSPESIDPHPELGAPTLTPTMIDGGEAANQVPDRCRITVDRRSVPPETAEGFARALTAHLRSAVDGPSVEYAHAERETPFLEAFRTDPASTIVERLVAAGAGPPEPFGAATEASYFAPHAPTVVFGPGELVDEDGPVAHSDREYVDLEAVRSAAEILERAIRGFLD